MNRSNMTGAFVRLLLITALLSILSSCMPTATSPSVESSNNSETGNPSAPTNLYQEPTYPLTGIFVQEGSIRTTTNFTLPVNFQDSFLIRGKELSVYLRKLPTSTNFCLVANYNYVTNTDRFLVLSAKPKSYTDLINKTTEFYLQVEPSNQVANQSDCLTFNLSNYLYTVASNPTRLPSLNFDLQQLCTNCSTSITSTPLKLFFINGEEVPSLNLNALTMIISGSSSTNINACVESSACKSRGYDCCLQGQCINDGALRPSAVLDPAFATAEEDVRLNPSRFVLYPQFYFVCDSRPDNSTGGSSGGGTTDPDYEAAVRLMELTQLHQCLNKVDGEFSYCTLKIQEASNIIKTTGIFPPSTMDFKDDVNFSTLNSNFTGAYSNNIVKVFYAGKTLYELSNPNPINMSFVANTNNDSLNAAQKILVTASLPANAKNDNLYLTYKVDGTCTKISATLARCSKTYIHNSLAADSLKTTYHDNSKDYYLPNYADINSNIIVKVSGIVVPEDSTTTWFRTTSTVLVNGVSQTRPQISFVGGYNIYQNQTVEISYFVTSNIDELVKMRAAAQTVVNNMCTCGPSISCNLKPLYNTSNSLVNYECIYPSSTSEEPPINQTVFVSSKNVPHRYYDVSGVNYDENYGDAPKQEELPLAFSYTNSDVLKPNNNSAVVGFNEIYGSFGKSGTLIARPAKRVKVKKDKQYDIIVESGVFSSCSTCGSDYYSALQKIFPQHFSGKGGGYTPDYFNSTRENSSSLYRSDDLLYGRACFLPATMIPWTHYTQLTSTSPTIQRRARLAAQHFLFANGYNRDWYGFDYGSIIGSFDGVKWFSVGNQRRIKAATGNLYLAVNAYFGDLNVDNNFKISVTESSSYSSSIPEHDTTTDGAECQKAHFCSNDNDCFRQLGYDYSCQNIAGLTSNWPQFDANGTEVVGSVPKSIASLVGGTNGQSLRCVYRGRGAPCLNDLSQASSNSFNGSSLIGTLACSPNNSCVPLSTPNRFNDRIARFANTPQAQNLSSQVVPAGDLVGLGAKIIGRPYDFYGTKSIPASAIEPLMNFNKVGAICIPGKDVVNSTNTFALNSRHPSARTDTSDKLYGVGTTLNTASMSPKYLNACPTTNASGFSFANMDELLGSTEITKYSTTQNLSSNLLDLAPLRNLNIFSSTAATQITAVGYQRNSCLRAAGASCFSNLECAPSSFISTKAKLANFTGILNEAEERFWEEELICGNPDFKNVSAGVINPNFNIKKNNCCRDIGKVITVDTQKDASLHHWCNTTTRQINVAGINTPVTSFNRYSRVHTGYDKMTCDVNVTRSSGTPFALSLVAANSVDRLDQILGQYKTLDNINSRTCCTKNWVRSFHTENGGGHAFSRTKMQTIDKTMFRDISWLTQDSTIVTDSPFECNITNYANSSCEVRSLTPTDEDKYLSWASSLELIGIPQVAVKTNDEIFKLVDDNQEDNGFSLLKNPLKNSIKPVASVGEDFQDISSNRYYSAASYTKFEMASGQLKKVFSENEFNCCVPSGQEVPESVTATQCCTGYVANIGGPRRCCLPDFTNVSVYLNRYVSSEGRSLPDNAYDDKTGYIKDAGQVMLMANQKNLCCSGKTMTGVAISKLSIPIEGGKFLAPTPISTSRRFNYRTDGVDNNEGTGFIGSIFDLGIRWNNQVYCVPEGFGEGN